MIGIGSDHLGFALKREVRDFLTERGETVHDFGAFTEDPVDYPDIGIQVAEAVRSGLIDQGVLVCGTGLGMAIVANKVPGVFAAPVTNVESAVAARQSNNAHIIALGARLVDPQQGCAIVEAWLAAEFRGGQSARKVGKIRALEERYRWKAALGLMSGAPAAPSSDSAPDSAAVAARLQAANLQVLVTGARRHGIVTPTQAAHAPRN